MTKTTGLRFSLLDVPFSLTGAFGIPYLKCMHHGLTLPSSAKVLIRSSPLRLSSADYNVYNGNCLCIFHRDVLLVLFFICNAVNKETQSSLHLYSNSWLAPYSDSL